MYIYICIEFILNGFFVKRNQVYPVITATFYPCVFSLEFLRLFWFQGYNSIFIESIVFRIDLVLYSIIIFIDSISDWQIRGAGSSPASLMGACP